MMGGVPGLSWPYGFEKKFSGWIELFLFSSRKEARRAMAAT